MAHAWLIVVLHASVVSLVVGYNHAVEKKDHVVIEVDSLAQLSGTKPLDGILGEENKAIELGLKENDLGKLFNAFSDDGKMIARAGKEKALASIAKFYNIELPEGLHDELMNEMGDLSQEDFAMLYKKFFVKVQIAKLIEPLEEGDVDNIHEILSHNLTQKIVSPVSDDQSNLSSVAATGKQVLQSAIDAARESEIERWHPTEEWSRKQVANAWNHLKRLVHESDELDLDSLKHIMDTFKAQYVCMKIRETSSPQRILRMPISVSTDDLAQLLKITDYDPCMGSPRLNVPSLIYTSHIRKSPVAGLQNHIDDKGIARKASPNEHEAN